MKFSMGPEQVILRGIRPEEQLWGAYQFPRPYDLGDRLVVAVHVTEDNIKSFGQQNRWMESRDRGKTWREIDPAVAAECGLRLPGWRPDLFPHGKRRESGKLRAGTPGIPDPRIRFSRQAEEGTLPIPDGFTCWPGGVQINAYDARRLPPSLAGSEWRWLRIPAGKTRPIEERRRWTGRI